MKVLVAGVHGKTARRLVRMLVDDGHEVRGLVRKEEQMPDIEADGAGPVLVDLENEEVEGRIGEAVEDCDAIMFAAGAGPGSGPERKETVDYGGAVKLIDAAERAGISRYVIVSSVGADADASGDDTFAVYLRAKGRADVALASSGLDYTIVRPGHLTDDSGTGRVRIGRDGEIPREDVSAMLAAVLHEPRTAGLMFELVGGDVPIDDAVAALVG